MLVIEPFPGVVVAATSRSSGDFAIHSPGVVDRRCAVAGVRPVAWLTQVHGAAVADFSLPAATADHCGVCADAAVTSQAGTALCVITADCVPIALWSDDGAIGIVHAGWRGLLSGVIERSVAAVRKRSGSEARVHALVGPSIHSECYEFGPLDLDLVAGAYGDIVRATTRAGSPALDMPAAVVAALSVAGAAPWIGPGTSGFDTCTACDDHWYSWRARRDAGRQALFIWRTS